MVQILNILYYCRVVLEECIKIHGSDLKYIVLLYYCINVLLFYCRVVLEECIKIQGSDLEEGVRVCKNTTISGINC